MEAGGEKSRIKKHAVEHPQKWSKERVGRINYWMEDRLKGVLYNMGNKASIL